MWHVNFKLTFRKVHDFRNAEAGVEAPRWGTTIQRCVGKNGQDRWSRWLQAKAALVSNQTPRIVEENRLVKCFGRGVTHTHIGSKRSGRLLLKQWYQSACAPLLASRCEPHMCCSIPASPLEKQSLSNHDTDATHNAFGHNTNTPSWGKHLTCDVNTETSAVCFPQRLRHSHT